MSQQLHQQSSFTRRRSSTLATPPLSPPPQARRRPSDTGGEVESPRLAFTPRLSNSPRISGRSDLDSAPLEDDEDWDEASLRREENEFERLLSTHIASVPGSFARKRVSDASPGGSAPGTPAPTALARPVSAAGQHALPPLSPAFSPVKRQSSAAELPLGSKDAAQTLPLGNIDLLKAFARFSSRGERESMPASNAVVSRAASITNRNRASSSATGRLKQYHTLPASAFLGKESMDAPASASAAPSAAHRKTNSLSHQRSLSMQRSSSALRSSNAPGLSRSLTLESITPAFLRFATLQGEVARTRADLKLAGQLGQLLLDQSYKMELQISAVEIRAEKAEEQLSAMQIRSDQAEMKAAECEVRAEQAEMKVSQLETELQQKQVQLDEAAVQAAQIAAAYQPTTPGSSSPLVSPTALSAAAAENESIHEYLRRQIIDTTRAMHEQAQIQQMKIASATSTGSAGESRPQPSPIGLVDFARPFSADQLRQKLKALNPTNLLRAYQQLHNAQQRQAALKLNGLEKQVAALSDDRAALSSKLSSSLSSSHALSSLQSRVTELEDERAELVERQRDQELQHQSAMKHRVKEMQAITKLACEGEIEELTSQVRTLQAALADSRMQVVQAQQQQQLLLSSPGSSSRKHTRSITGVEEALSPPGSRQHSRSFTGAGDNALTTPGQPPQQLHQPPPGIAAMSQKIQAQSAEIQALQAKVRELERGAQAGQQQAAGEETNPPAAAPGPAAVVVHHRPAPAYSMQTPAPSPHHRHHHSLLLPSGGGPSTTPQHRHHHSLALPSAGPTPSALYIPASPSRGLMMSASPRSAGGPLSGPSEPLRTLTLNLRLIHFPLSLLLPPLHDRSTPSGTPLSPASITAGSRYLVLSVFIRSATVAGNAYHFVGMTERFLAQPTSSSSSVENSESGVPSGLLDVMWTKPIDLKHYMTSSQNELLFSLYAVEPNHTAATAAADGNTTAVPQDRREKIGSVVVHSYHLLTGIPTTSGDPSNSAAASSTSSPRQHMLLLEASPESENSNENEEDELDGGEDDGVHSSRLSRSAIVAKLNLELLHQREKETNAKHSHRELQRQVRNERREALAGGLTRLIISCTITPTLHMEALPSPPSSASSSSSSHRQQPHGGGFTSGLTPMSGRSGQHTPREPQTPTSGRFKEPSRTPSSGRSAREAPNSGRSDRERRSRSGTVHNLPTTQTSVVRQIILSPTPKRLIRSPQQLPSSTQQQQLTTRVVSSPGLLDPLDSSRFSSGPLSSDVITSPGLTPHQSGPKHPLAAMPWLQSAAVQELLAMDDSQASHDTSGGGVDFRTQIERMLHDNGISTSVSDARAGVITTSGTRHARAQSRTPDHRYAARTSEYDAQPQLAEDGEEGQPSLLEPGSPEADANNSLSFTVSPFTPCQPYAAFVKEQARLHPYVHADDLWTKTMAEYASVMGVDVPKSFFPKNLFGSSIRESQGGELLLEEDGGVDDDDDDDSTSTSSDSEGETVLDTPTMLLRRQDAQKLHTETLQLQTSSPTEDLSSAPPVKAIHPTPSPQSSGREYDRLSSGTEPSPNAFGKVERSPESSAGEYERLSDSLAESPDAFESESLFQSKTYREAPATAASVQGASEAPAPTASDQPSEYSPPEAFDAATQYSAHEAPTRVASPVLQAKKPFGLSASLPVEVINLEPELPPSSSQPEPELYDVPLPSNDASSGAAGAGLPISDLITQLSFLLGVPLPSSHHLSSPHFSPSSTSALLGLVALFRTMWIDSLVWFARELSLREQQARQRQQKQKTEEKPTKRASKSKSGSAKKAAAAPPSSVQIRVCSATCTVCTQQYNLFRHEHFCRLCSSSCCDDCTSKRVSAAVLVGRMPGVHAIRGLRWDAEAQRCCHRCWLIVEAAEGKYQMKDIDMEEVD